MIQNYIVEIGILWVWFLVYMVIITIGKGPVSALYFYPKEVGDKAIELGLTTREEMNRRKIVLWNGTLRLARGRHPVGGHDELVDHTGTGGLELFMAQSRDQEIQDAPDDSVSLLFCQIFCQKLTVCNSIRLDHENRL